VALPTNIPEVIACSKEPETPAATRSAIDVSDIQTVLSDEVFPLTDTPVIPSIPNPAPEIAMLLDPVEALLPGEFSFIVGNWYECRWLKLLTCSPTEITK
jgi:hypothetical protein